MIPLLALSLAAACVATVHDGDTVRLCSGERVRIANIDAPELTGSPQRPDDHRGIWEPLGVGIRPG